MHARAQARAAETADSRECLRPQVDAELRLRLRGCRTLAAALQALGIPVAGWPQPTAAQVAAAFKRAALLLHPDRYVGAPVRDAVAAEEAFKALSRFRTTEQQWRTTSSTSYR